MERLLTASKSSVPDLRLEIFWFRILIDERGIIDFSSCVNRNLFSFIDSLLDDDSREANGADAGEGGVLDAGEGGVLDTGEGTGEDKKRVRK